MTLNVSVEEFLETGCGCKYGEEGQECISNFAQEEFKNCRNYFTELTKEERDLFILSHLFINRAPGKVNENKRIPYRIYGKPVCKTTFLYLLNISKNLLQNVSQHYNSEGLTPRVHGNKGRLPSNTSSFETTSHVKTFISEYAANHALPLPGRIPGYRDESISLISSSESSVWEFYQRSCIAADLNPVSYSLFVQLWQELIPWVVIAKPSSDLCWTCQKNSQLIVRNVPENDSDKAALYRTQLDHLEEAKREREYYQMQCEEARQNYSTSFSNFNPFEKCKPCSYDGIAHYSWDYAQQLHYPSNPQQPGPIFFKTPRKCSIFGVNNDALNHQFTYLIDEIVSTGKGANTTISYVHHFLENHGMGEKQAYFHADNCVGKYKYFHQGEGRFHMFILIFQPKTKFNYNKKLVWIRLQLAGIPSIWQKSKIIIITSN